MIQLYYYVGNITDLKNDVHLSKNKLANNLPTPVVTPMYLLRMLISLKLVCKHDLLYA